jgi:hypothetical protein
MVLRALIWIKYRGLLRENTFGLRLRIATSLLDGILEKGRERSTAAAIEDKGRGGTEKKGRHAGRVWRWAILP